MGISDTDFPYPLVGFRRDRLGARLIGLLDMIRLSRKFGVEARFLWLSQPDGPYPELTDPLAFFDPVVVGNYIHIVMQSPDLTGRTALSDVSQRMQVNQFSDALAAGRQFYGGSLIEAVRFGSESAKDVSAEMRQVMLDLPLAPRLADALRQARRDLAGDGQKKAAAIHVRRGDILDGDPWSYRAWPTKYVPDEFYRQFVAMHDGPVIAFSDTPAAVKHLAQGDPRIWPVDELLAGRDLSLAERDMLELLLMAECDVIAAPASSSYSQAATMIGGAEVIALPNALGSEGADTASDFLLRRVIGAPDSFFAPGDLAQSLVYATRYAVGQGRADELVSHDSRPDGFEDRFPFVQYWQALANFSAGQYERAEKLAEKALSNPKLRKAERLATRQLIALGALMDGREFDHDARFLSLAFAAGGAPALPVLAHRILAAGGSASQALMLHPDLVARLSRKAEQGVMAVLARAGDGGGMVLPEWVYLSGWTEFLEPGHDRENLSRTPALWVKTAIAGDLPSKVLELLMKGQMPKTPSDEEHMLLGFCAEKMRLHGQMKRAFALLNWLDRMQPGDALTHKRLADCYYQIGKSKQADVWLNSAISLAPDNALLHLSAVHRAIAQGQLGRARRHLAIAGRLWPGLGLIQMASRKLAQIKPKKHRGPRSVDGTADQSTDRL